MGAVAKETDLGLLLERILDLAHSHDALGRDVRQVLQLFGVDNQKKRRRERAYNGSDPPNSSRSSLMSNSSECVQIRQYSKRDRSMREAIQHHITDLVKSLQFKEDHIPDLIIEQGIANESEVARIRKLSTTEDQVSALVSHVLTCDYDGMDRFLKCLTEGYSQLEQKIRHMFDIVNKAGNEDAMPCAECELKARCNVKHVYNYLFEKDKISHQLHQSIAYEEYPIENLAAVWDKVLEELSHYPNQLGIGVLIQAFDQHDGHSNETIKLMLKRLSRKNRPLTCICNNAPSLSSSPESANEDMATDIASNRDNQGMDTDIASNRDNQGMATDIASNRDNQGMATDIASNRDNQGMATDIASNRDNQGMDTDIASNRDNQGMDTDIDCNRDNQNMETNIASNCDNQVMAIGIVDDSGNQDIASGIAKIRDSQDMAMDITGNRHNQDMAIGVASNCPKQKMATDNVSEINKHGDFVINTDEKAHGMTSYDTAKGSYGLGIDRSEYTERQNISKLQQAKKASEIPDQSQTQCPAYAPVEALSATDNRLAMGRDMKYDNVSTNFKEAGQNERKEKKFLKKRYNLGRLKEISRKEWKGKENLSQ